MRNLVAFFLLIVTCNVQAQEKKILDPSVYNDWKSLKDATISNDGKYVSYQIDPHKGDGILCIYNVETKRTDTIQRGTSAEFSANSKYIAFKIRPGYDTLRNCELNKVKKTDWPSDSLGIFWLDQDSILKMPKVKSFQMSETSDWMVVQFSHNKSLEKQPEKKKKWWSCKKKKEETEPKSDGNILWMFHPEEQKEYKNVIGFELSEDGNYVAFTVHQKFDKADSVHLEIHDLQQKSTWVDGKMYSEIQKMAFDPTEHYVAFLSSSDTSKVKQYALEFRNISNGAATLVADNSFFGMDTTLSISKNFTPKFTEDGSMLYFGIGEREFEAPKDTLLESEKVKLDIWHYNDDRLQPQQLNELRRDMSRSNLHVYHLSDGSIVPLANDTLRVYPLSHLKGDYLVGSSRKSYERTYNWVSPNPEDFYRINVKTGAVEPLVMGAHFDVSLAPSGEAFSHFENGNYYVTDLKTGSKECMTCGVQGAVWTVDMNGMPMEAYPIGSAEWNRDESQVYLQSEFDVWAYNRVSKELKSYTHELGSLNQVELRPAKWENDSVYFEPSNLYFWGFDRNTKGQHFYKLLDHVDHVDLIETAYFDAQVEQIQRSKNQKQFILRKMTFEEYPEVYTYSNDMKQLERISTTNPQQSDYNWGTVELTKWKSYNGIELEGLLYKPENYDSTKTYPLMVYFYELYSDRFHQYYSPKPTASIIYPTEYASAGYVVLIPDIRYEPGHPAKSAYDCIMSGTDHVLSILPNIDSNRMALQGQSWGGYQTAQLITMTKRYRAAMAGAPVANMFSAYGGIRWGSGVNRQFQYERTQSRIGYTIWERPDLYVENSPLFHLPNVETPLLIMHNDGDGAVPWYQGIELYNGLRRLDKKVWMLNYNDDDHNLMKDANRMDLSIRMRQFFDYYMLDAPAPKWLTDGIPATKKGLEMRYETEE